MIQRNIYITPIYIIKQYIYRIMLLSVKSHQPYKDIKLLKHLFTNTLHIFNLSFCSFLSSNYFFSNLPNIFLIFSSSFISSNFSLIDQYIDISSLNQCLKDIFLFLSCHLYIVFYIDDSLVKSTNSQNIISYS